jgi:pyridinium-3,5-bisthiocarboxylic acid mononucleotide nickel chelatase
MAHEDHNHDDDHGHGHNHDHEHHHDHKHDHQHEHGHAHLHGSGSQHDHPHEHPHPAGHSHSFAPDGQPHEHPAAHRSLLEAGELKGKLLFLDAFSGIAGDMTIAALLDLGVPLLVVERAVAALPIDGFHLHRGHTHRSGIVATKFDVHLEQAQPERTYLAIDTMIAESHLDEQTKTLARAIFLRLGQAEAAVHRVPIEEVHFHEVGAIDAIVDIVGSAACFSYLGATVHCSPLPMGRGFVNARHGILPLPAPATITCLQGVPTYGVDIDAELVTPTGAAIAATVAQSFVRWPSIVPERTGWGSGTRSLPDRPNLLRITVGSHAEQAQAENTSHVVIEANIDDMTGELAGYAIESLIKEGALDAWITPVTMKKGRPGWILSALVPTQAAEVLSAWLIRETTTLGVRRYHVSRTELPRKMIEVSTAYGMIPVKVGQSALGTLSIKPEFAICRALAERHGVPVKTVIAAALAQAPKTS